MFLHDVFVDKRTLLPTRVDFAGPSFTMNVQYGSEERHWVVRSFELRSVRPRPIRSHEADRIGQRGV